jgi:hypothetical protein
LIAVIAVKHVNFQQYMYTFTNHNQPYCMDK